MIVVQVVYNWNNESGGISLSIDHFSQILNSNVISFSNRNSKTYSNANSSKLLTIPFFSCAINRYSYTNSTVKCLAEQILSTADIVICHGLYRYHIDWAVKNAIKFDIPYIIIPHGSLDPYVFTYRSLSKKLWFKIYGNNHFKNASAIIFATDAEKNKAQAYIPLENSYVIHWPVDSVDTSQKEATKNKIRKELDIPLDAKVLLFIGRIHPMKRPMETIEAVINCNKDNVYLLLIGPDSDALSVEDCRRHFNNSKLDKIRFIKPVYGDGKFDYFMAADAFISLSFRENFGYTVAEALSTALPVILSPGNDLCNDIRHLNCGWLLNDTSKEEVNRAIIDFSATPAKHLEEMGRRGQQWARKSLSFETYHYNVTTLVKNLIAARK